MTPTKPLPPAPLPAVVQGSGPGVVLVHGAAGAPEYNFPFLDALAADHRVVAPYLPGTGPAPLDGDPDTDRIADQIVGAAVAAGLERFVLVGYSLGAALSVRAAVRHPERVRDLVLTAGTAHADGSSLAALRTMLGLMRSGDTQAFGTLMTYLGSSEQSLTEMGRDGVEAVSAMIAASPVSAGAPAQVALAAALDVRGDLAAVKAPTLVVATLADRLIGPSNSAALAAGIPGSRTAEISSGHGITGTAAEQWEGLIRDVAALDPT